MSERKNEYIELSTSHFFHSIDDYTDNLWMESPVCKCMIDGATMERQVSIAIRNSLRDPIEPHHEAKEREGRQP